VGVRSRVNDHELALRIAWRTRLSPLVHDSPESISRRSVTKSRLRAALALVAISFVALLAVAPAARAGDATFGPYYYKYPSSTLRSSIPMITFHTEMWPNHPYSYVKATVKVCDKSADGLRARAKVTYYDTIGYQWTQAAHHRRHRRREHASPRP
jgi:hypothetical protein